MRVPTLVVLSLLLASAAEAADSPDTHRRTAEELVRIMNLEKTTMAGVSASIEMQLKRDPAMQPYKDVFVQWAQKFLTWDEIGGKVVGIYADAFTDAELHDLIRFYKTPTGQKALAQQQTLMIQGASIGEAVAKEHLNDLQDMVRIRSEEIQKTAQPPKPAVPAAP